MIPQRVIVTGASSTGIGGAVARRFASAGASLFITSTEPEDLAALAESCLKEGAEVSHAVVDLSDVGESERLAESALAAMRGVDVLVNNAAFRLYKPLGEYTSDDVEHLFAVNLFAPLFLAQAVMPTMRQQGFGRIVNIASQMATVTAPGMALYGATKAALLSLTRSMALELASQGIAVNAVSPGPVASGYLEKRFADGGIERLVDRMPLGRLGQPDEIAEAVFFLAAKETSLVQGHNLIVDGGYTLQ